MSKIVINDSQIKEENINSALFLKYIEEYGFEPQKYQIIWELFQSPKGSMSQFLKSYDQYLISELTFYDGLSEIDIKGAMGEIWNQNIVINTKYFRTPVDETRVFEPLEPFGYSIYKRIMPKPQDVVIANSNVRWSHPSWKDAWHPNCDVELRYLKNMISFGCDSYLGFCASDNDKNLPYLIAAFEYYVGLCKEQSRYEYKLEHDTISSKGKELYLIRKKK